MTDEKTERQLLEEMNERLRQIAGLLAIQGKTQDDQIAVLTGLGFDSKMIGLFLGMSSDTVRVRRMRNKRR
jgi:hypothetical protein